jgi:hypothetical protein
MPGSRRARIPRGKRLAAILAAQLALLVLVALAGETFVRCWREGSVRRGFASYLDSGSAPVDPGTKGFFLHDPELGYRLNPSQPGFNSLSFRGTEVAEKTPGRTRLLVVGDSVAWDKDGFVAMLAREVEARAPGRLEVLNAAIPGYTTHQERIFLDRLVGPVRPDLVVVEYCLNDNHRFLHRLTEDGGWLLTGEARAALMPDGDGALAWLARRSYLAFEIRKRRLARARDHGELRPWESEPDFGPAWKPETWPAEREEFAAIHRTCRAAGAQLPRPGRALRAAAGSGPAREGARGRPRPAGAARSDLRGGGAPVPRPRARVRGPRPGPGLRGALPRQGAPDAGRPRDRGTGAARAPRRSGLDPARGGAVSALRRGALAGAELGLVAAAGITLARRLTWRPYAPVHVPCDVAVCVLAGALLLGLAALLVRQGPSLARPGAAAAALAAALIGWCALAPRPRLLPEVRLPAAAAPASQRSIVLVVLDTVRRSSLALHGYERRLTPNLDRWAEGALVFDQATSVSSWTLPAHASMFTGLYPRSHGAHGYRSDLQKESTYRLPDSCDTLAEIAGARGSRPSASWRTTCTSTVASGPIRGSRRTSSSPRGRGCASRRPTACSRRSIRSRAASSTGPTCATPSSRTRRWPRWTTCAAGRSSCS